MSAWEILQLCETRYALRDGLMALFFLSVNFLFLSMRFFLRYIYSQMIPYSGVFYVS
jgi:hypothetical protein